MKGALKSKITNFQDELAPIDDLSNSVQLFYQTMRDEVNKIKSLPPDFNFAKFMTEIETFVCVTGYHILFGSRFVGFNI